jgi:tRNA-dihydrouridine synthase B
MPINFWKKLKTPFLVMAPMAGITDSAFRQLCRKNGADVVYTEMISIDALYYDSKKTLEMLQMNAKERPVVLQLFGKRPELIAKAVEEIEKFKYSGIDLNFGCPARKVVAHEGGVSLLKDLNLCHELVHALCEATKLPVSVKTRVGINNGNKQVTVFDFLDKIKELPVSALMLHGRTYEQGFSGEVNYEAMKAAREKFNGVFIGNGGLNNPEDAKKMLELTGADGLGIARGVYGRPWIFKQIKDYLIKGKYANPTFKKIKRIALDHAHFNFETKGAFGIIEMRKHLCWYFRGFPDAAKLREKLVRVESVAEIEKILSEI